MDYIDLAVIEVDGVRIICQAPMFSYLKEGDKVMIGNHIVDVIASDSLRNDENDETVNLVLKACDVEHLSDVPKLTAKVIIREFIYDDDKKGGENE